MAVVASLVVKRFWPLRHSRYSHASDVRTRAIWEISDKGMDGSPFQPAVNARVISGHAPAEVAERVS